MITNIDLNRYGQGYWYLASPYSKYPAGLVAAFEEVSRNAGVLAKAGIAVFSPIAHTHPVAIYSGLDPLDHSLWLPFDKPMMDGAKGMIALKMDSWETSFGMKVEADNFQALGKPVIYMEPGSIPAELL